jgi:hypothetical protein
MSTVAFTAVTFAIEALRLGGVDARVAARVNL